MAAPLAIALRTMFMVLGCVIAAVFVYTTATDGLFFTKELLTPWSIATLVDFYISIVPIGVWILYKESDWIRPIIWIVLLVCLGSFTTSVYIVVQFLKLSPQESIDPIYFVLLRKRKPNEMESKSILSIVKARALFILLGYLMVATLVYSIASDGSPFRPENFTPWLSAVLVDLYFNIVALSVWVAYKESNWKTTTFWVILFICFGSVSVCAYIVLHLFCLSSEDPISAVLFRSSNRGYEGLIQTEVYGC